MTRRPLVIVLLSVTGAVALLVVLVLTARLPVGDTVLLPGTEQDGVRVVSSAAGQLSVALDVRNGGLVPLRVDGIADDRLGGYEVDLGRGVPGGGVPQEESFAPFVLWPGQQRLLVLSLTRSGAAEALELRSFRVAATVLGVPRDLEVELPVPVEVSAG